jgi:hypothetical protein
MVQDFNCGHWRSVAQCRAVPRRSEAKAGVQFVSKPEICQGILNLNCEQMRVSGCRNHYKFVLSAGAKAKSMTNNLPILSVLATVLFINLFYEYLN